MYYNGFLVSKAKKDSYTHHSPKAAFSVRKVEYMHNRLKISRNCHKTSRKISIKTKLRFFNVPSTHNKQNIIKKLNCILEIHFNLPMNLTGFKMEI